MRRLLICLAALLCLAGCGRKQAESVNVPILMYHHMDDVGGTDTVISVDGFRRQMDVLRENGYEPVSFDELIAYVNEDGALPEKPVCVTFDDGYLSTYETAWPILGEYGYPATVFAIGCSVGHEFYKDTQYPMTPHFGVEAIAEMVSSGRMAVQSHTYDMHQWGPFEETDLPRTSILPLEGESEADYTAALTEDFRREEAILAQGGVERIDVLAYPLGRYSDLTEQVLRELGVRVTLTIDSTHINTVTRGDPDSLYHLGRLNMTDGTGDEVLLEYLQQ